MMSLVDLFFSLLNFGIIIGVLVYAVKNFLVAQMQKAIIKDYQDFVSLHEEHRHLIEEQKALEEAIVLQEDRAKGLFKKINQWRNMVEITRESEFAVRERLRKETDEKHAEFAHSYALRKAYAEVAPFVVKKLEKDFRKKFADPQEGHAYIAQVLKKLSL